MSSTSLVERAGIIRGFNRFYTHQIGVLQEHLLQSAFSLTEIRVMYELSSRGDLTSADLCQMLGLDAGYLSRLISGLEKQGLIQKVRSVTDARAVQLHLSDLGRSVLAPLEQRTQDEVIALLEALPEPQQQQLTAAMQRIQTLLQGTPPSYLLRDPAALAAGIKFAQVLGDDFRHQRFELPIPVVFTRIQGGLSLYHQAHVTGLRIAEKDGEVVGSVFVVRHDASTAKLRMLYVDASARGMGIGQRLVDECLRFARHAGYKRMVLWTMSALVDARKLYQKAGFELIEEEAGTSFGKELVSQTWARDL